MSLGRCRQHGAGCLDPTCDENRMPWTHSFTSRSMGTGGACVHEMTGFCPKCSAWWNPGPLADSRVVFHGPQFLTPAQKGWLCPRCETMNAPWVPKCDCKEATSGGHVNEQLPWPPDGNALER